MMRLMDSVSASLCVPMLCCSFHDASMDSSVRYFMKAMGEYVSSSGSDVTDAFNARCDVDSSHQ